MEGWSWTNRIICLGQINHIIIRIWFGGRVSLPPTSDPILYNWLLLYWIRYQTNTFGNWTFQKSSMSRYPHGLRTQSHRTGTSISTVYLGPSGTLGMGNSTHWVDGCPLPMRVPPPDIEFVSHITHKTHQDSTSSFRIHGFSYMTLQVEIGHQG